MVAINTSPVLRGGDYITEYEAGATTILTDYVFSSEQETIFVHNRGVQNIRVVALGQTYKVPPNQSLRITENTATVQIKSEYGTQPFLIEGRASGSGGAVDSYARSQLTDAVKGETGKNLKVVACVLRNSGSGWQFINDTGHAPLNCASVTNDNSKITITYNFTAKRVVSFVACPDETMASDFMTMGASVGVDTALINLYQNVSMGGYIYYSGSAWVTSMAEGVSGVSFSNGVLTITHSAITGIKGNVTCRTGVLVTNLGSLGSTTTEVYFRDYAGALVTTPTADMKIYFERNSSKNTVGANTYTNPNGNIWCYGIFEV